MDRYVYLPETKGKSLEDMLGYFTEVTARPEELLSGGVGAGGSLLMAAPMRGVNSDAAHSATYSRAWVSGEE